MDTNKLIKIEELENGEYAVDEAREDLRGLIGSSYDTRIKTELNTQST